MVAELGHAFGADVKFILFMPFYLAILNKSGLAYFSPNPFVPYTTDYFFYKKAD